MITTFFLGAAIGLILAITGAGGGILAVPLLIFATGIQLAQAAPIGLIAIGLGAGLGALLELRQGIVRYRAALLVAASGMLLSPLGVWTAQRIDNRILSLLFSLVLLYVSWLSRRKATGNAASSGTIPVCICDFATGRLVWTGRCARALAQTGAASGFLSGLLGVGGGFVLVPALRRCTDLPANSSVATSLAVIFLISIQTAGFGIATGTLAWSVAVPFCAGTVVGMVAGRTIAGRIPDAVVHNLFAALAAGVGLAMLASLFSPIAGFL